MSFEHLERLKWVEEIAKINRRLNGAAQSETNDHSW